MTHHYRIDVSADNRNGIGQRFALLPSDVLALSEKPTTLAPGGIDVSKERRVRVEASKKQLAMTLCFNSLVAGLLSVSPLSPAPD